MEFETKKQIQNQLVNYELSLKLKELGIKQKSFFYYDECNYDDGDGKVDTVIDLIHLDSLNMRGGVRDFHTSAFTASELLEMLPNFTCIWIDDVINLDSKYACQIDCSDFDDVPCFRADNSCNALAKMLIYLKENNLIKN